MRFAASEERYVAHVEELAEQVASRTCVMRTIDFSAWKKELEF